MASISVGQNGKFTTYGFEAGGYEFSVLWSPVGYWSVYRHPKGAQRNMVGKTFWNAEQMIAAYKTAGSSLRAIVAAKPGA
jgi:hypothetical protein